MKKIITSIILAVTMMVSSVSVFAETMQANDVVKQLVCEKHKWSSWETTKPASHKSHGIKVRRCTKCNRKQTKIIPIAHKYTRKGNVISCKCGHKLFNPANKKGLNTKLYKKKAYKLNSNQITAFSKFAVYCFGKDRDMMEAGLSTMLNLAESEKISASTLYYHIIYEPWKLRGTYYPSGLEIQYNPQNKISDNQYLVTKYVITKGFRVFPRKVTWFAKENDVKIVKVKVNGKSYKVAKSKIFNDAFLVYRKVGKVYYGSDLPANIKKALK